MRHQTIPLASRSEWTSALQGIPHSFAHTWESCHAMSLSTGHPTYLYCFESTDARVVCPIAQRSCHGHVDIVTPYGFSGFVGTAECAGFPEYWREFARSQGYVCGYIGLHPAFDQQGYAETGDVYRANTLYLLDLTIGLEALMRNLHENRRRQVKQGLRAALQFVQDRNCIRQFLITHHGAFMERVNGSAASRFSAETLSMLCDLDNTVAVAVAGPDGIEAASLFGYTNFGAEYLLNVSLPGGQQHTTVLLWQAIGELKRLGSSFLNLGGGIREGDALAEYKRRFGAAELPFRCLKQVYDTSVYSTLCRESGVDPKASEGYFPAYRVKAK